MDKAPMTATPSLEDGLVSLILRPQNSLLSLSGASLRMIHYPRRHPFPPGCRQAHNGILAPAGLGMLGDLVRSWDGHRCRDLECYAGHQCPNLKCDG